MFGKEMRRGVAYWLTGSDSDITWFTKKGPL